jgi:hypothetical protein
LQPRCLVLNPPILRRSSSTHSFVIFAVKRQFAVHLLTF